MCWRGPCNPPLWSWLSRALRPTFGCIRSPCIGRCGSGRSCRLGSSLVPSVGAEAPVELPAQAGFAAGEVAVAPVGFWGLLPQSSAVGALHECGAALGVGVQEKETGFPFGLAG